MTDKLLARAHQDYWRGARMRRRRVMLKCCRDEAGKLAMVLSNKAAVYRRRPLTELGSKSRNIDRLPRSGSRAMGSRVGDDLVEAFEEMARHLRGEIELEAHDLLG